MTFSPDNTVVAYGSHSSASVGAFSWSSVTGFGSKFSDPSTMPSGTSYNIRFNSQGTVLAVAHATSPYITTYPWSNGFGAKFSNPAIPLGDNARAVCFSPDGAVISIANISTVISSYAWSNGFGTKYADLTVTPFTPAGLGCDFSSSGATLVVCGYSTPYIAAYPWSNGYGTKYANPSTLPLQNCFWTKFNKDGSKIACGWQVTSPFFYIYNWSNGFGSKLTDPSSVITGTASYAGDFGKSTANSNDIAIGQAGSPFINAYTFNSSSVGTKYANPSTLPPSDAYSVSFSN